MPNPTVIVITNAKFLLGDAAADVDPPGTGTGKAFECQISSAAINATPNMQTVPATFCSPESQAPAATGFELALTWLQDWTASSAGVPGSLSAYALANDTLTKYFSLTLVGTAAPIATGQCRVVAGAYGGDAGTPLTATAVWPLVGKPTISEPTMAQAAAYASGEEPPPDEAEPVADESVAV